MHETLRAEATLELPPEQAARPRGRRGLAWLGANWALLLGILILCVVVLPAIFAPVLPIQDPAAVNPLDRLEPAFSPNHLLGTDELGRDLLSRLVWGARVSLTVGLIATLASLLVGTAIGVLTGFFGGWTDRITMRLIDVIQAFPFLLLAVAIVGTIGPGLVNAMIAISVVGVPFYARMSRGLVLSLRERDFTHAARAMGASPLRIIREHILPNIVGPVIVFGSLDIGYKIIATAGLSFLGLGTQPPDSDWGTMLADGFSSMSVAPQAATVPGLAILLVVLSFNLIGDGLRDRLDPRLAEGRA